MSSSKSVTVERLSTETAPLFSVIMPVYNKEPYIRDTIASVLAQTCSSYEVVMIGGVSSDNTDGICREFAAAEPARFRFVVQSGKGAANARNDGILAARGRYVAFLDADDLWVPEYLAVMERLIADFPAAKMFIGGHRWKFQDGHVMNRIMSVPRGYIDIFRASMEYDGFAIQTFCVVCERAAVMDIGLFRTDYVIGEDTDLITRMALLHEVAYEPQLLGTYLAELPSSLCKYSRGFVVQVPADAELSAAEQTSEIVSYHERWILSTVLNNLDRGNHKEARDQLSRVTVGWNRHKRLLWFLSYLPTPPWMRVHEVFNTIVWRHKWDEEKA
ncbi:glycosyltransferase family 2 protein [Methanocorpusculum vombati]|uniref:Glycosyltransferase n=1 Tax=Methanocorpusculum vombati TaxID=3002864 RepID=A0ABT4IL46_9EURY|nr:glycosyltransferase [Methanocorpusculum vombati]MCZ9319073.1 glycosyltransferase [Methanocorpusculum sp.]MCZ0862468.1 glycosyltransferase [Methanocorpusculum vombati]MDE2520707.1 glycosyltransferase [Methanocorpusculum sp.]MDE2534845.1 glycosyltransferase [Methanocorpusculum sp.]MDE2545970.1 glycosyltransferase [Methanocorpusculum sp.]